MGKPELVYEQVKPVEAMDVAIRRTAPVIEKCLRVQVAGQDRISTLAVSCYLQGVADGYQAAENHMSEQKPSVGRIVHFEPDPTMYPQRLSDKGQPHAAVITHVWSDTCVNLCVLPDGTFRLADQTHTSVNFGGGPRTWSWPPRV